MTQGDGFSIPQVWKDAFYARLKLVYDVEAELVSFPNCSEKSQFFCGESLAAIYAPGSHHSGKKLLRIDHIGVKGGDINSKVALDDFENLLIEIRKQNTYDIVALKVFESEPWLIKGVLEAGFRREGEEYRLSVDELSNLTQSTKHNQTLHPRKMDYENDIDSVIELEIAAHSNDSTSIVDPSSEIAINSMRQYFQRACQNHCVLVFECNERLVGELAFMRQSVLPTYAMVSSMSIHPQLQGQGLMYSLIANAQPFLIEMGVTDVMAVTKTERLLGFFAKNKIRPTGAIYEKSISDFAQ